MKRTGVTLIAAFLLPLSLYAQTDDAVNEKLYGEELKDAPAASLAEILEDPESYNKKEVTLEGTVADVCQNKGCWMFVTDGKQRIRVDFKNYGFFVPWDSEGKRVRIHGKVYRKLVDKNVVKHWLEEQKDPDLRPEEITEDVMMTMMTASGVLMAEGRELSPEQLDVIEGKVQKEH